jgi:beta-lactamase regulating signal transducer with metallopeptidase domain/5-hydroxyisourate hydrolase-like protein (transthyretin family)/peroxiredoxin
MSASTLVTGNLARLAEVPAPAAVLIKVTALLALAWALHAVLAGRNPRWRVALWRATAVALAAVPALVAAPPVVSWRLPTPATAPGVAVIPSATAVSPEAPPPAPWADRFTSTTEPPVATGPAPPPPLPHADNARARRVVNAANRARNLSGLLVGLWATGVLILSVRLWLVARRLARLVSDARPAPGWIEEESHEIAVRLRGPAARVVLSSQATTPFLAGLSRPVVVLSEGPWTEGDRAELRAVLAHELAHVRGGDLVWNGVLQVVSLLLWFHPLAWRARAAHAGACDAVAADLVGDVTSYGRTLAQQALRACAPPPVAGLAMARTCDVRRRIEALRRRVFRSPLPGRLFMPAIFAFALTVMLVGGTQLARVGVAATPEPPTRKETPKEDAAKPPATATPPTGRLTVHVTNAQTGEPIEGVQIDAWIDAEEKTNHSQPVTGKDGTAVVEYDPAARIDRVTLTPNRQGFVPAHVYWDDNRRPIQIPQTKAFALEPGTTIGGVVNDEQGRPIEGATVTITVPATESDLSSNRFPIGVPKTDAKGRWVDSEAPADLSRVSIRVEHPKYQPSSGKPSRGLDSVTAVLREGAMEPPARKETPRKVAAKAPVTTTPPTGRLTVHVTNAQTGEPIEGVEIDSYILSEEKMNHRKAVTGKDGTAVVEYDPAARVDWLMLTPNRQGFVPANVYWDGRQHPIQIPPTKSFALEPGTTIGGVVNDEKGRPIEGATVRITMPATESNLSNITFPIGVPKTDARGRWVVSEAPADLSLVSIRVEHPSYQATSGKPSRGLDSVTAVLREGPTVSGRVVDRAGKPVSGARVLLGQEPFGGVGVEMKTDSRGTFKLASRRSGPSIVTVLAEGFAPAILAVNVEETGTTGPVELKLEPASVIRIRVVDVHGKPVRAATCAVDTWRGHRTFFYRGDTDDDGRLTWKNAPTDAVLFDIFKTGFMRERLHPFTASDEDQVVVLHPELSVSGRVTDAATGKPVPSFRVIRGATFEGSTEVTWWHSEALDCTDGRYTQRFDQPMKSWHVRVEAPGYKPAESRAFRSDEGATTQDFALQPGPALSGVILLPDGKPADGAEVALATRGVYIGLHDAGFNRGYNVPLTKTGPDGRFTFTPPDKPAFLIAAHEAGFAETPAGDVSTAVKLTLRPWGRLVGKVMIGTKPGANQRVLFEPKRPEQGGAGVFLRYGYDTQTDGEGRFVFDRIVPGPGTVSRVVVTAFPGGGQRHTPGWPEPYDVKPGGTAEVTVGGKGRAVVGRVVVNGTPDSPLDWRQNSPAEIKLPRVKLGQGPRGGDRYASNLDRDGRFRVDDVPPGRYELTVPVNTPPDPSRGGAGTEIGRATLEFTVPEGPADAPVDVGEVVAKLLPTLKVGDLAPDFTAQKLGGGRLKLGDFQGKLVLLDFWATWCGPCLVDMPAMKDLQETFGRDGRFVLVGLSCDEEPEGPARYAREHGLSWTQGFAGNLYGELATTYLVKAIPATFLIGPDGRILAKNLRGPALKEAIRKALNDDHLFAAGKGRE